MSVFSLRIHDRLTEDDPHMATVMHAKSHDGPWYDMVSGDPEFCWEIVDALQMAEDQREARRREEAERLRIELERERSRTSVDVNGG